MSDISSLTLQVQQLGRSYDSWTLASQVLIGITAVATLLYFGASSMALKKGKDLKTASETLDRAKDDATRKQMFRLKLPRWAFVGPLGEYLKDKPRGAVEIIFVPENDEAQKTAMGLEAMLSADGKWQLMNNARPYSEQDVLPKFLTPEMKKNPFHISLFERVGGLSDITVLASPSDFREDDRGVPKGATAVEALWRGLHTCDFEAIIAPDPALAAGTARIVVGPKQ